MFPPPKVASGEQKPHLLLAAARRGQDVRCRAWELPSAYNSRGILRALERPFNRTMFTGGIRQFRACAAVVGCALVSLALTTLLAACSLVAPPSEPPASVDRAAALASQGDQAGAAREYESLANETYGAERTEMLLRAAGAYLGARRIDDLARVLEAVQPPLTSAQSLEQQTLLTELEIARGRGQQAWQHWQALSEPSAPAAAVAYLDLKRRAAFASGRPLDAVSAEIDEERFLTPDARQAARKILFQELSDASARGMSIDARAAHDSTVRGWLALAPIAAEAQRNPVAAAAAVEAWRASYPDHPATGLVQSELLGAQPALLAAPHIALLLPLTGREATAAATVRDGFLTAYYVGAAAERPRIRIYDTGDTSVAEVVDRATREGANFIVGPLTREEVVAAAALPGSHPPMLALNFLPAERQAPSGFYQFALSPEDEARAAARRVLADGHRHGVALVPEGDWGNRVLAAFSEELTAGGGTLIDTARFDPGLIDYAPAVTRVLGIDQSNARFDLIKSIVGGKLQFQPRRRGDIEFIFEASSAQAARLLRPQIRFYFAGDVPAYSTSDAYEPDSSANQDLDGLDFPEMPWALGSGLADSVRLAAQNAWPVGGPPRDRIFAFGFDAYRLLMALKAAPAGSAVSVEGLTGELTIDSGGRVRRELEWAQLRDGQPHPLLQPESNPAPQPEGTSPRPPSSPSPPSSLSPPTQPGSPR